jgi:hypothetical protein
VVKDAEDAALQNREVALRRCWCARPRAHIPYRSGARFRATQSSSRTACRRALHRS